MTDTHEQHDTLAKEAIRRDIEEFGCHLALIEADNYMPAFAYTIGLYEKFGHPEIICFGLSTELLSSILNQACSLIREGKKLTTGVLYPGFILRYEVQLLEVDKAFYPDYMGYGMWYYDGQDFPALQLVWPDMDQEFPWEENFNPDYKFRQPLLDRNTDFRFYEERNLGVYTTRQVLEGEPILYVYHNEDGDWQFHSSIDPDINDGRLVSLESLVKKDPSLNDIHFLQYDWRAWRGSVEEEWQYEEDGVEN